MDPLSVAASIFTLFTIPSLIGQGASAIELLHDAPQGLQDLVPQLSCLDRATEDVSWVVYQLRETGESIPDSIIDLIQDAKALILKLHSGVHYELTVPGVGGGITVRRWVWMRKESQVMKALANVRSMHQSIQFVLTTLNL